MTVWAFPGHFPIAGVVSSQAVYAVSNPEIQQSIYPVSMDYIRLWIPFHSGLALDIDKDNDAYGAAKC